MPVRIIAEIGVNHNGSVALARDLIDAAKACGADMVKFQTFSADRLAGRNTPKVPYQLRTSDPQESHHAMLRKLELSKSEHRELKAYCEKLGIEFCSTPYSKEDAEFLYELGVRFFKVASADLVDRTLHEFIAATGKKCILATGMSTIEEIAETLHIYDQHDSRSNVILLQCTSSYPAEPADANLLVMTTLRNGFGCPVGYSDHTAGNECAIAAAALGAAVIEKHFTLDKDLAGPDHAASANPEEFKALVRAIRLAERAVGDGIKRIASSEQEMRKISRKSVVAARDLPKGHTLCKEDLAFQRPGNGLSPMRYPDLVGRTLNQAIPAGAQLHLDDCHHE